MGLEMHRQLRTGIFLGLNSKREMSVHTSMRTNKSYNTRLFLPTSVSPTFGLHLSFALRLIHCTGSSPLATSAMEGHHVNQPALGATGQDGRCTATHQTSYAQPLGNSSSGIGHDEDELGYDANDDKGGGDRLSWVGWKMG